MRVQLAVGPHQAGFGGRRLATDVNDPEHGVAFAIPWSNLHMQLS